MDMLSSLVAKLDDFFRLQDYPQDPSFSQLLPLVYEEIGLSWQTMFEPDFVRRFNGLMLRGAEAVNTVFCAVLPTPQVLKDFLDQADPGDLFFTHHPIDFEMGDPRGAAGRGPLPIERDLLDALVSKGCSFYVCHAPLDHNQEISTSIAMEQTLGATYQHGLFPWEDHYNGSLCTIPTTNTEALIERCLRVFDIPYVDIIGMRLDHIERVAIIPGGGDKVELIQEAEEASAQALIGGEVRSQRQDDYGRAKYEKVIAYLPQTRLSLIGVSHAASEHGVMETHIVPWLVDNFQIQAKTIRMENWWR
jgi:putative NIF3 family GTP cyclohydrolase 1 type 2